MAAAEPDNTTYRRDLSVSYERLADLARAARRSGDAEALFTTAAGARRALHRQEPTRTDLAEELAVTLTPKASLCFGGSASEHEIQLDGQFHAVFVCADCWA